MLETLSALVPRVEMTAIKVLPVTGVAASVRLMAVDVVPPVVPVVDWTRLAGDWIEMDRDPTFLSDR